MRGFLYSDANDVMQLKAIEKAQSRLRNVHKAVNALPNCATYLDFIDVWAEFLHAAKGIYTTLEQGAKTDATSRQWFGNKNNFRRKDPLLRYITEARNDDEHGIEQVTEYVPGALSLGVNEPGASQHMIDDRGNVFVGCGTAYHIEGVTGPMRVPQLRALDGKKIVSRLRPPHPRLVPVYDRSRNRFDPPTSHLDRDLTDTAPNAVAALAADYLAQLVAEAEQLGKK